MLPQDATRFTCTTRSYKIVVFIISLKNNEKRLEETGESCNQNYKEIIIDEDADDDCDANIAGNSVISNQVRKQTAKKKEKINAFHATGLFQYYLKNQKTSKAFYIFRE